MAFYSILVGCFFFRMPITKIDIHKTLTSIPSRRREGAVVLEKNKAGGGISLPLENLLAIIIYKTLTSVPSLRREGGVAQDKNKAEGAA